MLLVCGCVLNACSRLSLVFTIYRRSVYSFISVHVYTGVVVLFIALAAAPVPKKYMVKKTFSLSDVLHVTVTKQSQVQFINKPVEKAIGETFVNFTLPHWISLYLLQDPK